MTGAEIMAACGPDLVDRLFWFGLGAFAVGLVCLAIAIWRAPLEYRCHACDRRAYVSPDAVGPISGWYDAELCGDCAREIAADADARPRPTPPPKF